MPDPRHPLREWPLLERIEGPADLRRLQPAQLETLARELRGFIVQGVSRSEGHFAAGPGIGVRITG